MDDRVLKPSWRFSIFVFICTSSLSSADRGHWFWSRDAIADSNLSCGSIIRPTGRGQEQKEVFRFTFNKSPSSELQWRNENELDTGNRVGGECAVIVVGPTPTSRLALRIDASVAGEYQCLAANALSLYDLGGGRLLLKDTICGLQRNSAAMETTGNLALVTINLDDIQKGTFILHVSVLHEKHQQPHHHQHPMKPGVFLPTFTTPKPAQLLEHFTTGHQTSSTSDVFLIPITTTKPDQVQEKPNSGDDSSPAVTTTTSSSEESSLVNQTTSPQELPATQQSEKTTEVTPISSAVPENSDSTPEFQSSSSPSPDPLTEQENSPGPLPEFGKPGTLQPTGITGDNEETNEENFKEKTTTTSSQTLTSESNNPSRRTEDSGIQFVFTRDPSENSITTDRFITERISRKPGDSGIQFVFTTESDTQAQNSVKPANSNALRKPNGSGIQFIFTKESDDSPSNAVPSSAAQENSENPQNSSGFRKPSGSGVQFVYPVGPVEAVLSEEKDPQNLPVSMLITEEPLTTKKLKLRDSSPSDMNLEATENDVNGGVSESSMKTTKSDGDSNIDSSLMQLVIPSKNVSGPPNDELVQVAEQSVSSSTSTQDITSSLTESNEFTISDETLEKPNWEILDGSNNIADMYGGNNVLALTNLTENNSNYAQNASEINDIQPNLSTESTSTVMDYASMNLIVQPLNASTNLNKTREVIGSYPFSETSGYSINDMIPNIGNMYGVALPWRSTPSPNAPDSHGIPESSVTQLFSPTGNTSIVPDGDFIMQSDAPLTSTENFINQVTDSGTYDEITETSNGENEIDIDYIDDENRTLSSQNSMTTITSTGQTKYEDSRSQPELRLGFPLKIQSEDALRGTLQFVTPPTVKDEFFSILSESTTTSFSTSSDDDEGDIDITSNSLSVPGETSMITKESHTSSTTASGPQIFSKSNVDLLQSKLKDNDLKINITSTKERDILSRLQPEPIVFDISHTSNALKENVYVDNAENISNISTTNVATDLKKDPLASEYFLTSKPVSVLIKEQFHNSIDNSAKLVKTLNASVPKYSLITTLQTSHRTTKSSQGKDITLSPFSSVTPSTIPKNITLSRGTTTVNLSGDTLSPQPDEIDLSTKKADDSYALTTNSYEYFSTETNYQKLSGSSGKDISDEGYATKDKMFTEDYSIVSTIISNEVISKPRNE